MSDLPLLDYAPKPPARSARRWLLRGVAVLAVLATAFAAARVGQLAVARYHLIVAQRACLDFTPADGAIAFDEDPARAAALWASLTASGERRHYYAAFEGGQGSKVAAVWLWPRPWSELAARSRRSWDPGRAVLFLHGRRASAGAARRLVTVGSVADIDRAYSQATPTGPLFETTVARLATAFSDAATLSTRRATVSPDFVGVPTRSLRFHAGRTDPADESHFTIDYETPGGRGTIDGWLMPDDTVKLEVRDAPAARR